MGDVPAVEVSVEPAPDPVSEAPTVVIVEDASDGGDSDTSSLIAIAATLGAVVEKLNALESRVAGAQASAEIAEGTAELALEVAGDAIETAAEVAEETATPAEMDEIIEDVPPNAVPWFARSLSDFRGGQ